jgi:ribonuclease P protein component
MNPISKQAPRQLPNEAETASRKPRGRSLVGLRLCKHSDFQRAYAAGRKRQSASMSWFLAPQSPIDHPTIAPRVGLTVGKVLGKAHDRNRIKRRMREALRHHVDLLPEGFDFIFHPRRVVLTIEFPKLEAEIVRILNQARAEIARGTHLQPPAERRQRVESGS